MHSSKECRTIFAPSLTKLTNARDIRPSIVTFFQMGQEMYGYKLTYAPK